MSPADDAPRTTPPRAAVAVRIVGCGRSLRSDDQAGLIVAEALAFDPPTDCVVEATESPLADLPTSSSDADLLIVIDACLATPQLPAGRWRRIEYHGDDGLLRARRRCDTHTISVDAALELASQLGTVPPECWIYALSGTTFEYGEALSPPVAAAINPLAARIRADLRQWRDRSRRGTGGGEEVTHARAVHRTSAG